MSGYDILGMLKTMLNNLVVCNFGWMFRKVVYKNVKRDIGFDLR